MEYTRDAIADKFWSEICEFDRIQTDTDTETRTYHVEAIRHAHRRGIVNKMENFEDIFVVYIQNFSAELAVELIKLSSDLGAIHEVMTSVVRDKLIKKWAPMIYDDYFETEPLRWRLIDGDGNGKGNGSVIVEHIETPEVQGEGEGEEDSTIIQKLARWVMKENIFKTTTDTEELYWYNNKGVYLVGQEWRIKSECQRMLPKIKTYEDQEIINHIKRRTFVDRSEFDPDPDILNTTNGLMNMRTRELSPHTPEYLSIIQIPIEYKPRTVCPKILEFLGTVIRPKDIHVIIQLIGYCLVSSCEYEVVVMLFGGGANGKGTLLKSIEAFLGVTNCSHRSLQDLDSNRFAVADLYGKLANLFADLKSTKLTETGHFKMIASGDPISGEKKFKDAFAFRNRAKMWYSANEIPESDDKTDAYYRRWRIFHFDKQFLKGKENTKLIKNLTTPQELTGLLNLALIGLNQLLKKGGFHDLTIDDIRRDYEIHTNDVNAFLYEECLVDITNPDYSTLATDAYAAYVNFCVKRGTRSIEMSPFGKKLADRGIYNQRHKEHGQSGHYYDGIILIKSMRDRDQTTI